MHLLVFLCVYAAKCGSVRPIRQWQTEGYHHIMDERRQSSSSRHRACDLSIRGEALATPSLHQPQSTLPSGYITRTGDMHIETVHRACTSKTAGAAATRTRASKATGACMTGGGSSPDWDFDPFLKDDTGRMISTRTPVAKMTAPVSMVKKPRVDAMAAKQQPANKSDGNKSSKDDDKATAAKHQDGSLDRNSPSNRAKTPVAKTASRASQLRGDVADKSDKNKSSSEKVADEGRRADDSTNEANTSATSTPAVRAHQDDVAARKTRHGSKSDERPEDDRDGTESESHSLPPVDIEPSPSVSAFHQEEKRRRSPSLQVLCSFYPDVTTLRSGLCYHKSVCRL